MCQGDKLCVHMLTFRCVRASVRGRIDTVWSYSVHLSPLGPSGSLRMLVKATPGLMDMTNSV